MKEARKEGGKEGSKAGSCLFVAFCKQEEESSRRREEHAQGEAIPGEDIPGEDIPRQAGRHTAIQEGGKAGRQEGRKA